LVALIALYLGVIFGKTHSPALGLDLKGGTTVLLQPADVGGNAKITKDQMAQAVTILRRRVNANGVTNATVQTEGSANIRISVPSQGRDVIAQIDKTALVRFRQVLVETSGSATAATTPTPVTTDTANPSATVSLTPPTTPTASGSTAGSTPSVSATSNGRALPQQFLAAASATSSPSATPTSSSAAAPSPSAPAAPTPPPLVSGLPLLQSTDSLPASLEQQFSSYQCPDADHLAAVVPDVDANATQPIIACGLVQDQVAKYVLGPEIVPGKDIRTAFAGLQGTSGVSWAVNLELNGEGTDLFGKATAAVTSYPSPFNQIAIVLDGVVESAPYISQSGGISGGRAEISGTFNQSSANDLANVLKYGALPLKFTQSDVQSVSATLGSQQLRGGLIAGAIGLGLVVIFSLLYYRALGIVTVGSLAVSALILYAVTTLLGHSSVGYTLSLPGIAGFIVAIGITADSFVVFFERIRDEIREGRRLRSAVDRGWPRARRTILSADTVSLLAAFVLYVVSIGDVRGFAFTLGMSTLSDLFIVFFFTKPLLQVMGKWRAFDSGKAWTGIGRARAGVVREAAPEHVTRRSRTREA
jgi:preprotein translocase subunit SecD